MADRSDIPDSLNETGVPPTAPPMSASLLGRLFLVPAILVSLLVLGMMTVVLMFGWPGFGQRATAAELLTQMESSDGGKYGGMALMPRDKDVWLAAQELAERLRNPEKELKPEEFAPTAARLTAIFHAQTGGELLSEAQSRLAEFALMGLTRLRGAGTVETLVEAIGSKRAEIRAAGVRGLVEMRNDPSVRGALAKLTELLDDADPQVRVITAVALGQIAKPSDTDVIHALAGKLGGDQELEWNAALAVGRLGSSKSKLTLMSMLDRAAWLKVRVRYTDQNGLSVDRPATDDRIAGRIDEYLVAAIDAAANVPDSDLRGAISALKSDPSAMVRQRAANALDAEPPVKQIGDAGR